MIDQQLDFLKKELKKIQQAHASYEKNDSRKALGFKTIRTLKKQIKELETMRDGE